MIFHSLCSYSMNVWYFVYGLIMIFDASSAYLDTRYVIFKEVKDKTNQCLLSSYRTETIENSFNYKAWHIQLVFLINYFNIDMM